MHSRELVVLGLAALLLLGAAETKSPPKEKEKEDVEAAPEDYLPVIAEEIEQRGQPFVGARLRVKDRFYERMTRFPGAVARFGISPETHIGFRTHPTIGANMLCFLPKSDEEGNRVLGTLVKESPILVYGKLVARDPVTRESIFILDRLVRGWDEPIKEKIEVVMTMEWEGSKKPLKFRLTERNKGKKYYVRCPYTGKPLYLTFEW